VHATGPAGELLADPALGALYLGGSAVAATTTATTTAPPTPTPTGTAALEDTEAATLTTDTGA
jgi:hypothetical protein